MNPALSIYFTGLTITLLFFYTRFLGVIKQFSLQYVNVCSIYI